MQLVYGLCLDQYRVLGSDITVQLLFCWVSDFIILENASLMQEALDAYRDALAEDEMDDGEV